MSHTRSDATLTEREHDRELEILGWPPLLTTPRAVVYTGRSKSILLRAARAGALPIAGRQGRVYIWRRVDLDLWLTGREVDPNEPRATITPIAPIASARRQAPLSESLARIRKAAGREP
jgi:hypothetical protein